MLFDIAIRRADWINQRRAVAYPVIFLVVYLFTVVMWNSGASWYPKHGNIEFARDFVNVYVAGQEVRENKIADVYDINKHKDRQHAFEEAGNGPPLEKGFLPWLYPPMFLGVAWLVAFLPYYGALAAYLGAGFAAYAAAMCKLAGNKKAIWAIAAFPGAYVNALVGQNGFITTALLAAGLSLLDKAPVAAGAFFGILSYKPQFFILIPLVLFVGRYWKALISTCISACVCAALSFAAFGLQPWLDFVRNLPLARTGMLESETDRWLGVMHTVFSAVRMLGGGVQTAYVLQSAVSVLAVLVLLYFWSRKTSLAVRGASLCAVLLLASPYSFAYDQVVLAIPIALLAIEGAKTGFYPYEKIFLFALWLLPTLAKDHGEHFALPLSPPMLMLLLYYCWLRARQNLRQQPQKKTVHVQEKAFPSPKPKFPKPTFS